MQFNNFYTDVEYLCPQSPLNVVIHELVLQNLSPLVYLCSNLLPITSFLFTLQQVVLALTSYLSFIKYYHLVVT